jgi:hypothetical protein
MDHKLHRLDSFSATGSDGQLYKVSAYEHLVRDPVLVRDVHEHWISTGQSEYRLDDGSRVEMRPDGTLRVAGSGIELQPLH